MSKYIGDVSAYAYAVSKGYIGTEEEFAELMAAYADVGQTAVDAKDAAIVAKTAAETATSKATIAAQTANTKAGEAQTSAQTASSKASEASQSASQASGYAQTAETAKTDAQTAKTQAETARDNAVTAKTAAETAQGKAEDAQAAAETAQGAAEDAAESASASATASAQSASQASASEQGCERAVLDATSAAAIARARADEASGYAQTASTKASEAVGCVETATQKATESAQSASQALDYKNNAESAKAASQTAQGKAESARDSAISAKNDAESARDEAQEIVDGINAKAEQIDTNTADIAELESTKADLSELYKAFPTDTASGAIASFTDGADGIPLKSLVVDINPVQSGTGDPSPDNVRPISGWTEVDVEQSVVNIFDKISTVNGYIVDTNGELRNNLNCKSTDFIPIVPNTSYYIKSEQAKGAWGAWYDKNKNYVAGISRYIASESDARKTITAPSNARYMRLTVEYYAEGTIYGNAETFSVNYPSTDHDYHPYTGRSITIDLGQTVYGGKLDVLSGVLRVDRAMVDLGTLDWITTDSGKHRTGGLSSAIKRIGNHELMLGVCSSYEIVVGNDIANHDMSLGQINLTNILINDSRYNGGAAADFATAMMGVQLVYELATPIEIQLSANQLNSLYGVNNIWADSGDTTAEYRADTKLFIERLTAPDSADMIADANITSGQYFMVGNSLYKATANIANGAAIIVGTNAVRKSLSEALNALKADYMTLLE